MKKYEILARNLASSTYSNENELKKILVKLTDSDIESLTSACFRAAEKCSLDVFDCNIVIGNIYQIVGGRCWKKVEVTDD